MPENTDGDPVIQKEVEKITEKVGKSIQDSLRKKKTPGLGFQGDAVLDKELAKDAKEIKARMWKHYKVDQYGDKVINKEINKMHEKFSKQLNDEWLHDKKLRRR